MKLLRDKYSQLLEQNEICYSNPITRFAYIYAAVRSHANLVCTIINNYLIFSHLFDSERVNVACIGGEPGSDFLGIIKYLRKNIKFSYVKFHLCDREKTWAESWSDVDDKLDAQFRISTSYLPLDVVDSDDWKPHQKYFHSDLFTMIYFMSEVFALRDSANEYFDNLFEQAKLGSLFLFVDNNNPEVYGWFDRLAQIHNINMIESNETQMRIPFDEQKSDLGIYIEKFTYPKLGANVAYRIGRKE